MDIDFIRMSTSHGWSCRRSHEKRPTEELCIPEEARLDFDEAMVPEDEVIQEGEFEVEAILDEKRIKNAQRGQDGILSG
jgi:hypothetical protein